MHILTQVWGGSKNDFKSGGALFMSYDIEQRAKELVEQYKAEQELEKAQNESQELPAVKEEKNTVTASSIQDEQGNIDMNKVGANYFAAQINSGASLNEVSMDVAKATMTNDIFGDQSDNGKKYRQELKDEQKQTIKESFKQDRLREQKQTLDNKREKAESFYLSVRPILEFDFGNLVGNANTDKEQKQYKDRSYGIPLMALMIVLLVVPYCAITIILALFNGINAVLKTISTFGKISRYIAYSVFVVGVCALVLYVAILGIQGLFNVQILP